MRTGAARARSSSPASARVPWSSDHHHHLVCRHCARTIEVADPPVEQWAERIAAEHDFSEVSHTVEIIGTCSACASGGGSNG